MVVLLTMIKSYIFVFICSSITFSTVVAEELSSSSIQDADCVLPPYPENGGYTVSNYPTAKPGERYPSVKLTVSCNTGYLNKNTNNSIFCVNGDWSASLPTCSRFCTLIKNLSVEYRCIVSESLSATQECETLVPAGTIVTPICRSPNYFSHGVLPKMHCVDGIWDSNPICTQECGRVSSHLQLDGLPLKPSNPEDGLPWHATIYIKRFNSFMHMCSGSLITTNKIISAAHCFRNDLRKPLNAPDHYVVTVGDLYRNFKDPKDTYSQISNVIDIKIPTDYQETNFENNIAIVIVDTPFTYSPTVRPVCLDFDDTLDKIQLADGNKGRASGWNINGKTRQFAHKLKIVELPYIKMEDCFDISPASFQKYLTSDKFCVGSNNGTSLCQGDGGSGITFLESTTQRYYLRGVYSNAPYTEDVCGDFLTFTSIIKHESFIKQHL